MIKKCILECGCDPVGTLLGTTCDSEGECQCKDGYTGDKCDQCEPGFYTEDGETCLGSQP